MAWEGVVMRNGEVAPFIKKHGAPVHSKPHGPEKTILYYPKAGEEAEDLPEFKDYAGTPTPGSRSRVVQAPLSGSPEVGSTVVSNIIRASVSAPVAAPTTGGQNPNRLAEEAELVNLDALDDEINELEDEQLEKKLDDEDASAAVRARKAEQNLDIETPEITDKDMVTRETMAPSDDAGVAPELKPNEGSAAESGSGKKSTAKKTAKKSTAKKTTRKRTR